MLRVKTFQAALLNLSGGLAQAAKGHAAGLSPDSIRMDLNPVIEEARQHAPLLEATAPIHKLFLQADPQSLLWQDLAPAISETISSVGRLLTPDQVMASGLEEFLNETSIAVQAPVAIEKAVPVLPTGKGTVLVVDDDPIVQEVLSGFLIKEGYTVINASSGEEAIAIYDEGIDLLITDYWMPGMNGVEILMEIRRRYPQARILITSAGELRSEREKKIVAREGYAFLIKTHDLEHILEIIEEAVKDKA